MTFEHPLLGLVLDIPEGWRAIGEIPPTFVAPDDPDQAFAPNVVVTAGEPGDPATAATQLAGALIIDAADDHVLLHHFERGIATVLEQWWTVRDGRAWVVSASSGPLDYDALADTFADIAQSLRFA